MPSAGLDTIIISYHNIKQITEQNIVKYPAMLQSCGFKKSYLLKAKLHNMEKTLSSGIILWKCPQLPYTSLPHTYKWQYCICYWNKDYLVLVIYQICTCTYPSHYISLPGYWINTKVHVQYLSVYSNIGSVSRVCCAANIPFLDVRKVLLSI